MTTVRHLASRVQPGTGPAQRGSPAAPERTQAPSETFAEQLRRAAQPSSEPDVKLSAHAQERLEQRGISMDAEQQRALGDAMQTLEKKGARDAVLLRSDAAFVVNVPNRTVVTAMSQEEMQQRAFTQIDSALIL